MTVEKIVPNPEQLPAGEPKNLPTLQNGDRLTRDEFERRYQAMPHLKKAELIQGVVYIPSHYGAVRQSSARAEIVGWLGVYSAGTPGVRLGANPTVRLDVDNEPQPDGVMLLDESAGGQSRISDDGYVEGAPEFIAEVAASSASYDVGDKLTAYRRNGVREYLVWRVYDSQVDWYKLTEGEYTPLQPDEAGVLRSEIFPGLWLRVPALLAGDLAAVLAVLQQGLATPAHAAFVESLTSPKKA